MADLDLNELERLEKAATPGPWKWAEKNSIDFGYVGPNGERTVLFGEDHEGAVHQDDPDGKFLAALRNALPELLRRLRAAEAECAIRNDEVSGLQGMLREAQARIAELEASLQSNAKDAMQAHGASFEDLRICGNCNGTGYTA